MRNGVEQFFAKRLSSWGAPQEQRDEVTADIGKLVFQGMQTRQTERMKSESPSYFPQNGS